jgi:hypothetical protein
MTRLPVYGHSAKPSTVSYVPRPTTIVSIDAKNAV